MIDNDKLAQRLLDLQAYLLPFLDIQRRIYLPDGTQTDRRETDTEHSFHLAMLAWYVSGFFPNFDQSKVIKFALAHDLVEIHAGDVMAIGRTDEEHVQKVLREKAALEQIKKDWPDFVDMTESIEAYESQSTPEAVFVKALDKIAPQLQNLISHGKTWKKLNIQRSDIIKNKDETTKNSPEVNALWQVFREICLAHDDYFNEGKAD